MTKSKLERSIVKSLKRTRKGLMPFEIELYEALRARNQMLEEILEGCEGGER